MKNKAIDWQTQVVLLTGATGGIGMAIAKALAKQGCTLILQGRNKQKLDSLQAQLAGDHTYIVADLATTEGLTQVVNEVQQFEHLSMLINAAGINHFGLCEQQDSSNIAALLQLNLTVPIQLINQLLPTFKRQKDSHIVNVGSVFGSIGFAAHSLYCASKFGLRGYSEALQRELTESNVSVHYLAPRATQTEMNSESVQRLNQKLGNSVDTPDVVANTLIQMLNSNRPRQTVGFPEKLFARINGVFPELVDAALNKKLKTIEQHAKPQQEISL